METMETHQSVSGVVEKIIYFSKEIINRNCHKALDIEGVSACPYTDRYCPYRAEEPFSPQKEVEALLTTTLFGRVIEDCTLTFVPGKKYIVCSREPKTAKT